MGWGWDELCTTTNSLGLFIMRYDTIAFKTLESSTVERGTRILVSIENSEINIGSRAKLHMTEPFLGSAYPNLYQLSDFEIASVSPSLWYVELRFELGVNRVQ